MKKVIGVMNRESRVALIVILLSGIVFPGSSYAEDINARLQALEKEIATLKKQQQAKPSDNASVHLDDKKGLVITSPNKDFELRVHGYAQIDDRTFLNNDNAGVSDQFLVRTARPIFEGKINHDYYARLMLDFGNNQSRVLDAFADYKPLEALNVRVGKFKAPIGLERWQPESDIAFIERGLSTNLVPFRDLGVQVYGDLLPKTLEYQVALTNGVADLGDSNGDSDNGKDVTGRLFAHPLKGLGIGIAGSVGDRKGNSTSSDLTSGYNSFGQNKIFSYGSGVVGDGTEWRLNPQANYYYGPFGFLAEYVKTESDVRNGTKSATLNNDGWSALASYVLTGENASFDGVKVNNDFDPESGQWGAWEILGRVSQLNIDSATFPTYADPTKSVKRAQEYVAGVTWYLNNNLKWNTNYAYTAFDGGAVRGDRQNEQAILNRLQFRF